jgi:glyoxylase-like metal-dependent hydrolase (beta-lactamase superfamily II)
MRIHTIDLHFQNTPGLIAAYLVECGDALALIETGPGSCRERLITEIKARGFSVADIRHVFVTHIHLDHSGGAGWWAQQGAVVYCHPNAAKHLIDPSRLTGSARLVYGDRMDTLWGAILPAPESKVIALPDGGSVSVGTSQITAWDTPGHARHHHAFVIGDTCFTGDVAGVRLEGSDYLSVAAAPPQFDPEAYITSVDRLLTGSFHKLCLAHFGIVDDPAAHLRAYRERISEVSRLVGESFSSGDSIEQTRALFQKHEHALAWNSQVGDDLWRRYELANATGMCADGIRLHHQKRAAS